MWVYCSYCHQPIMHMYLRFDTREEMDAFYEFHDKHKDKIMCKDCQKIKQIMFRKRIRESKVIHI